MTHYINYNTIIEKIDILDEHLKEYGKLGNSTLKMDTFNCFSDNIKLLLQQDLKFFKTIINLYNSRFTCHINNNKHNILSIDSDGIDKFFKVLDKRNKSIKTKYIEYSKEIISWLKTTEFFNYIVENKINITEEDLNNKKENIHIINKWKWRTNQEEAINRLINNGLETGIHCQATGTGKSYIILKYIEYMKTLKTTHPKIILFTERVNILADLFHLKKGILKQDNKILAELKEKGICDITDYNIINRVTIKTKDWDKQLKESTKPTLLVINRAFLTLGNLYKKINKDDIDLILHDECHNTTSQQCHNFLLHMRNLKIPIVGFSATPLRTGKYDKSKLLEIYPDPTNNKILNLLTNYNMIYSIQQKLILPPEFYWYQIESTKKHKDIELVTQEELGSVLELLNQIMPTLPNKKLVAWCGTIKLAQKWKELFEKNHKQRKNLKNFTFGLDTSFSSSDDYEKFKNLDGNSILFCAAKHREGSDIKKLDGCIFLDKVKDRGSIPFIQSIGRVLRLSSEKETPKKTKGVIIDGYVKDNNEYEKSFIDKIIGYYMMLLDLTEIDGDMKEEPIMHRYIKLLDIIKFDKKKETIQIQFGEVNICINCNKLEWDDIIPKFHTLLEKKLNLSKEDAFEIHLNKIKNLEPFMNPENDFWEEYKKLDHDTLGLPVDIYEEYKTIWETKTWYDVLGFKIYTNLEDFKKKFYKKFPTIKNMTDAIYKKIQTEFNLPNYPFEYYKIDKITDYSHLL